MIIAEATKLQPYLDFIQDKDDATQEAKNYIHMAKHDLNKRPLDTFEGAISFLKNLTEEDIRRGNIQDRILFIIWARRVVNKHCHLNMVEAKWNFMHKQVNEFPSLFNPLVKRGLPLFWEEKGLMLS